MTLLKALEDNNSEQALKIILEGNIDLNVVNERGESALFIAIEKGYYPVVNALILAKADVNQAEKSVGMLPLAIAFEATAADKKIRDEILYCLLQADNIEISIKSLEESTDPAEQSLARVARAIQYQLRRNKLNDLLNSYVVQHASLTRSRRYSRDAIYLAILANDLPSIQLFLKYSEEGQWHFFRKHASQMPNKDFGEELENEDLSYFDMAVALNRQDIVNFMLQTMDSHFPLDLKFPIKIAIARGFSEVAELLCKAGAEKIERPSKQAVRMFYNQLFKIILSGYQQSISQKKKLLIMVGEVHTSLLSLYLKFCVIDICNKLDIKNCLLETDEDRLDQQPKLKGAEDQHWIKYLDELSEPKGKLPYISANYALRLGMRLTPVDLMRAGANLFDYVFALSASMKKTNQRRESIMSYLINKINENCVLLIGDGHMQGLLEECDMSEKYHVVPLTIVDPFDPAYQSEPLSYVRKSDKIIRFSLNWNEFEFNISDIKQAFDYVADAGNLVSRGEPHSPADKKSEKDIPAKELGSVQLMGYLFGNPFNSPSTPNWLQKMHEEALVKKWEKEYNEKHPNREENGYGAFALVVKG